MAKVSIIIPCYNTEKTVCRAVKSIVHQSYRELDIILVNDASTDGTGAKLKQLADSDSRIHVICHDKNLGLDYARFTGVGASTSEYLCFLDADDTMTSDAIASLLSIAEKEEADIVEGASSRVLGRLGLLKQRRHIKNCIIYPPELMEDYFISFFGVNILGVTAWGKLYKRDLFVRSGITPSGFKRGQDLIMNMKLFPFVRKYVTIDHDIVHYYYGGVTSTLDSSLYDCLKKQYFLKLEMIDCYGYTKAKRTTGIEMCNVLNTAVQQMLLANLPYTTIRQFLEKEASSGFLDEISSAAGGGDSFLYIANKNLEGIIQSQRSKLWRIRLRRLVANWAAHFL